MTLAWQQRWAEALSLLDSAVQIHGGDLSADHYYTVMIRAQRAMVRLQAGRLADVQDELAQLIEQVPELRDSYPRAALLIHNLAARYALAVHSPEQALAHTRAIEQIMEQHETHVSLDNSELVALALVSGDALAAADDLTMAALKWAEAQSLARQLIGPEHPLRLEAASRNPDQQVRYVSSQS